MQEPRLWGLNEDKDKEKDKDKDIGKGKKDKKDEEVSNSSGFFNSRNKKNNNNNKNSDYNNGNAKIGRDDTHSDSMLMMKGRKFLEAKACYRTYSARRDNPFFSFLGNNGNNATNAHNGNNGNNGNSKPILSHVHGSRVEVQVGLKFKKY